MTKPKFPAPYTPAVVDAMLPFLEGVRGTWVDPCAGQGLSLQRFLGKGHRVVGIEIEQPNVDAGIAHGAAGLIEQGDSTELHRRFRKGTVAAIFTSLAYGNRFADSHNAQERCRVCRGTGKQGGSNIRDCSACGGEGRRHHTRRGYTHDIRELTGDPTYRLHENNAGGEHFGPRYKEIHRQILRSCLDVAKPGAPAVINVSDFIRGTKTIHVVTWHLVEMQAMGWVWENAQPILNTPRMRYGQNREARIDREWVLVFRKPHPARQL